MPLCLGLLWEFVLWIAMEKYIVDETSERELCVMFHVGPIECALEWMVRPNKHIITHDTVLKEWNSLL